MGNCLQATETDDVDLLHNDNESVNVGGGRRRSSSGGGNNNHRSNSGDHREQRGRTQSSNETTTSVAAASGNRPARSSRRNRGSRSSTSGENEDDQSRRRSNGGDRSAESLPPPYEITSMQGSASISTGTPSPIYHPSPGVSRQASELTEEEQIKIAQRIGLIQHLPIDIYVEGHKSDTECIICMADFVDGDRVRFLPCLHTYHVDCIDEWLMRSFNCPACLEPVDSALLTSYDQQQTTAFDEFGSSGETSDGTGSGGLDGFACRSLPRQLEQLQAITSPPSRLPPPSSSSSLRVNAADGK